MTTNSSLSKTTNYKKQARGGSDTKKNRIAALQRLSSIVAEMERTGFMGVEAWLLQKEAKTSLHYTRLFIRERIRSGLLRKVRHGLYKIITIDLQKGAVARTEKKKRQHDHQQKRFTASSKGV